jgi:DNA invertase Pin-like site-specific DNA recombinase
MIMNIGYKRVSSIGQDTGRQLDTVPLDRTYSDHWTGAKKARPQLDAMLAALRVGDVVHVHSIDRLARSLMDLQGLVESITCMGATVKFHKEALTFSADKSEPMAVLMLQVMGAIAQFERELIRSRSAEGIAKAKQAGKYKGGKDKLSATQCVEMRAAYDGGHAVAHIAKLFKVTRPTVYKYLAR